MDFVNQAVYYTVVNLEVGGKGHLDTKRIICFFIDLPRELGVLKNRSTKTSCGKWQMNEKRGK